MELQQIERRRTELEMTITAAGAGPAAPALHPQIAQVFVEKIRQLAAALEDGDLEQRELARQTLRGFVDRIVIPRADEPLQVVRNLGEMLTAADGGGRSAAVGNGGCGGRI